MKIYKTKCGMQELLSKIVENEKKLSELQSRMTEVADQGNQWHDNAAYDQFLIDVRALDRILQDLYKEKNNAIIVVPNKNTRKVSIGSKVKILVDDEEKEYVIVGYNESDLSRGFVAYDTPLGNALMGKEVDDELEVILPSGNVDVEVIQIIIEEDRKCL